MDNEQKSLLKYAFISVTAMGISLVLIALISRVNTVAPQTDVSARTIGMVDDSFSQVNLYIENDSELRNALSNNYAITLDQILQERYNKTTKIERYALLDGSIKRSGDTVSFRLKFLPSNQTYNCTVNTGNSRESVRVSIEEVL